MATVVVFVNSTVLPQLLAVPCAAKPLQSNVVIAHTILFLDDVKQLPFNTISVWFVWSLTVSFAHWIELGCKHDFSFFSI